MPEREESFWEVLKIAEAAVLRGLASLPFEHPFEALKTRMQAANLGTRLALTDIYRGKGVMGFYAGFVANCLRTATKMAYRWPVNIYLLEFYRSRLSASPIANANRSGLVGLLAGLTMALLETVIICPFEKVKVWLMTSVKQETFRSFFHYNQFTRLFDGMVAVGIKQAVSWTTFMGSQEYFKAVIFQINGRKQMDLTDILIVSFLVSFVNTLFVMPVDYVKTQYQKYSSHGAAQSARASIRQAIRRKGFRALYAGWHIKIVQYNINSIFTVGLFEQLRLDYSKKRQ